MKPKNFVIFFLSFTLYQINMLTVDYLFLDHECYFPVEPKLYNDREVKEIKYQRNSNSYLKPEVGYFLEEKGIWTINIMGICALY